MSGLAVALIFNFYGLAFFVMGVSVLLSAEYRSDLFYTRHIGWLASFGVLFGIAGFIAGQAALSNDPGLSLPIIALRTLALGFSSSMDGGCGTTAVALTSLSGCPNCWQQWQRR